MKPGYFAEVAVVEPMERQDEITLRSTETPNFLRTASPGRAINRLFRTPKAFGAVIVETGSGELGSEESSYLLQEYLKPTLFA